MTVRGGGTRRGGLVSLQHWLLKFGVAIMVIREIVGEFRD